MKRKKLGKFIIELGPSTPRILGLNNIEIATLIDVYKDRELIGQFTYIHSEIGLNRVENVCEFQPGVLFCSKLFLNEIKRAA